MNINITQDDIDAGNPNDRQACAIALALLRDLKARKVQVAYNTAKIAGSPLFDEDLVILMLPRVAINFIQDFDAGEVVYETSFELILKDVKEFADGLAT